MNEPTSTDGTGPPALRVVRGEPDPAELAALVTVLGAGAAAADQETPAPPSAWTARTRAVRAGAEHGPGAWRASSWPT